MNSIGLPLKSDPVPGPEAWIAGRRSIHGSAAGRFGNCLAPPKIDKSKLESWNGLCAVSLGDAVVARRHNDPARTREQILAKATDEFARLGFEGGRVDRIAARCNLSKNMLYYYFHSKEKLFVAVLERMYERMRDQQRDLAVRTSDPAVALEQLIRYTFNAFRDDPTIIRLMNEENKHKGKYLKKSQRVRDLYGPLLETLTNTWLEAGKVSGKITYDEGVDTPGPVIVDCRVEKLANCFPMIPSGAAHTDMLLHSDEVKGTMDDEAKALV